MFRFVMRFVKAFNDRARKDLGITDAQMESARLLMTFGVVMNADWFG